MQEGSLVFSATTTGLDRRPPPPPKIPPNGNRSQNAHLPLPALGGVWRQGSGVENGSTAFLLLPFPSPTPQKSPLAGMEGLGGRGWEGQARQRHAGCGLGVLGRVVAGNR